MSGADRISGMGPDDETAVVVREAILTEALRESSRPSVLGRMLDTYSGLCRIEGAQEALDIPDEDEGQSDWRDIEPPDGVTFDDDAIPNGTERVLNELIECHADPRSPQWAVYMGLLERLPDEAGEYAEFDDLHSAADPWGPEAAHVALADLTTQVDGCFAVHFEEPRHSDPEAYSITQIGQAIKEWWKRSKYDQLRN